MHILLTGGAGYIGSHTYIELVKAGFKPVILDNFYNAKPEVLKRLETITGAPVPFVEADIRDRAALDAVFAKWPFTAVVHFAGLKAVGESVAKPLMYYDNNVSGTVNLLEAMAAAKVKQLVFSSSATVYGDPHAVPIREDFPLSATNPYGRSKLMIEDILRDLYKSDASWDLALLRYFNPVGAHESGLIGENPKGIPNNLIPYVTQVAIGKLKSVGVFGNDYDTPDGTGVRDYIHVVDLAAGHVCALEKIREMSGKAGSGVKTYNLGTGRGYSVLDIIKNFEKACGREIPYEIKERRPGDIATCYADATKAREELHWTAQRSIEKMCEDSWRWQSMNPEGL